MEYKAIEFKAEDIDAKERIISGYASTWDLDQGDDIILRGAFANTLATHSSRVKLLWQHNSNSPIGKPRVMRENDKGLYVEAYVAKTAKGDEALQLAEEQIIDRFSIGFTVNDADYREDEGKLIRTIKSLDLWEFSLVTWPMNEAAVVTSVKSLDVKEIERVLREAGLSRSQAKAIACAGVRSLREADQDWTDAANQARDIIKQLRST